MLLLEVAQYLSYHDIVALLLSSKEYYKYDHEEFWKWLYWRRQRTLDGDCSYKEKVKYLDLLSQRGITKLTIKGNYYDFCIYYHLTTYDWYLLYIEVDEFQCTYRRELEEEGIMENGKLLYYQYFDDSATTVSKDYFDDETGIIIDGNYIYISASVMSLDQKIFLVQYKDKLKLYKAGTTRIEVLDDLKEQVGDIKRIHTPQGHYFVVE